MIFEIICDLDSYVSICVKDVFALIMLLCIVIKIETVYKKLFLLKDHLVYLPKQLKNKTGGVVRYAQYARGRYDVRMTITIITNNHFRSY